MNILGEFLRNPSQTGAIAASSSELGECMIKNAFLEDKTCVVEIGPGTGIFSKKIMGSIRPEALFFSIEINQIFIPYLQASGIPVHHGSALAIKKYLATYNRQTCDAIISGLPWASFELAVQSEILAELYGALEDGGCFVTFSYLQSQIMPTGAAFKQLLQATFSEVTESEIIWKNFPPAFVYRCLK
jgi:phospholipid N-methyltransferase